MRNNPYLYPALRLAPEAVRTLVDAVPEARWDMATDPDRFTFRQAVAHLADWEEIDFDRIKTAVESPRAEIPGIDETDRMIAMDYDRLDPREQVEVYAQRREALIVYLQGLPADAWARTVVHAEKGEMSVYDWANCLIGHDLYHIEHLGQFLR